MSGQVPSQPVGYKMAFKSLWTSVTEKQTLSKTPPPSSLGKTLQWIVEENCSSKLSWWEDCAGNCRGGALGAYSWPCLSSPGATFATFFLSVDEKFNLHCALHNQYQSSMSRLVLLGFRLTYSLCFSGPNKAEDMRYGGHLGSWETLRENFWRGGQNGQQGMR